MEVTILEYVLVFALLWIAMSLMSIYSLLRRWMDHMGIEEPWRKKK